MFTRRNLLAGASALGGAALLPSLAHAKGSVIAATYPGSWEEAYRTVVAPAVKKSHDIDLELQPLYAVDQIAKVRAARGAPPFDAFVLDPGPRITGIEGGLFEKFDGRKITNASKLPAGMIDEWGICVGAQVVGIGYNPKKLPPPKDWKDLLVDPWVSRLGITGFQTTFGTVSLIEIAKAFGGSETNVEPALVELKKALPKIAAVGNPAAMAGLLQQGQCDITYTNIQTVAILKSRGVDIEFVKPASGAVAFFTTMHIAKGSQDAENAYKYFDTVVSKAVGDVLCKPPHNFIPVNKEVVLPASLPMRNLDEMATYVRHDWSKINPLRAGWIEKFNKEMAK
ncbi:MAG: extracellular solute-binding protein [Enhydrobacter sp.]|nr:MAG: extracellular solute-binding protein [Enhydrobacter sp.]